MSFQNQKKTFLEKLDKSKKGSIDEKALPIINTINKTESYYTTSSCSGRVYFWQGSGKKNETQWLKVSHDTIEESFLELDNKEGTIWLRYEGFIIHIACKDLESANSLLQEATTLFKKSSILTISKKIIVEIRSSQLLEMPFYKDDQLLYTGDISWLTNHINKLQKENWKKIEKLKELISSF